jgi:hypothetical protein
MFHYGEMYPIESHYMDKGIMGNMTNPDRSSSSDWFKYREEFIQKKKSFIPGLLPERAVRLPFGEIVSILRQRLGDVFDQALSPESTELERMSTDLPVPLLSPVSTEQNGRWLRTSKMVGINIRTIGSFWEVISYALTLPSCQNAIHLLPVWEPGVVSSLYGMISWEINPEFYNRELALNYPWLNSPGRQLRAIINILHALGKAVGMDVIPHTDRFSEMALANPDFFEWIQRRDTEIISHSPDLVKDVKQFIYKYIINFGSAIPGDELPADWENLFSEQVGEAVRLRLLFGPPDDYQGRLSRRLSLIRNLYLKGYETVPVTMAPPFRGIEVDPSPEAIVFDEFGQIWRDFRMIHPQNMSRVFNPLARYHFYENQSEGDGWQVDFDQPRRSVWKYFCQKYALIQETFGFDFMRGDMSHVQMRPDGVPSVLDEFYDPLGAVKQFIQNGKGVHYFGYFAESFLAPRDVMGYGEEIDHLEASFADATLGDLQSVRLDSALFRTRFRAYIDLLDTRRCAPCFTVMTSDKDDPRFDSFYLEGNDARFFISIFLGDMPAYMALGFETRDSHPIPAPNEHYSKLYVFKEKKGEKATHGPFVWGKNKDLYTKIERMRLLADRIWPLIRGKATDWLIPPDATGENPVLAWTQAGDPQYLFLVNTSSNPSGSFGIVLPYKYKIIELVFSTITTSLEEFNPPKDNGIHIRFAGISAGEGRVYALKEVSYVL